MQGHLLNRGNGNVAEEAFDFGCSFPWLLSVARLATRSLRLSRRQELAAQRLVMQLEDVHDGKAREWRVAEKILIPLGSDTCNAPLEVGVLSAPRGPRPRVSRPWGQRNAARQASARQARERGRRMHRQGGPVEALQPNSISSLGSQVQRKEAQAMRESRRLRRCRLSPPLREELASG
jgi:hypothetical protein